MKPIEHYQVFDAVPSVTDRRLVLRCPPRGMLDRLRVVQVAGALEGFSYALYNSTLAFQTDSTLAPAAAVHQVAPQVDVPAGATAAAANLTSELRLHYANVDPDEADGRPRLNYQRHQLHLWIRAAGTGDKSFAVATCVAADFN